VIRLLIMAVFLCGGLPGAGIATAQGQEEGKREKAKRLVGEAQAAFKNEEFELCAEKFRRAYRLAPLPQIQFNLGLCYERLERFRDASIAYEGAATHKKMPEEMRQKAKESLDKIRKQLAKVRFEGSAGNGKVDGSIPCKIPCSLYLDPGAHQIIYGDDEQQQDFSVIRGRAATVVLAKAEADDTKFDATESDTKTRTDLTSSGVTKSKKETGSGIGWLTWGGGGMAAAGATGALVFGLKTRSLHDDFMRDPTVDDANDGIQARRFTNISIGVAVTGASLLVYDLLTD
jgi:hypothetical protein